MSNDSLKKLNNDFRNASSHVERDDWADNVKAAINDLIDMYGSTSSGYMGNAYAVSDFDNTAAVFDVCEQFMIYQAQVMGYGFTPQELPIILSSGRSDMDKELGDFGYGKGSYNDWISDITAAYTYLYDTYGPFTPEGLDEENSLVIQKDPMWSEFTAKMMNLYLLVCDNESRDISLYWYTGMTEEEVYNLARRSHEKYKQVNTTLKTIQTPENIETKVGAIQYSYPEGIQVTENTREMWQKLDEAGIDVWVCTAAESDIMRGAVDEFGLHDYCTGLIGMTPVVKEGKLTCTYDYESGCCWYADRGGGWHRGTVPSETETQGAGKVTAIQNICVKEYGCGPLAGFMDSTGDYNLCTEFDSLKLVICFNRADRKVTDGGSVIAQLAVYQQNELGYNLAKANKAGDTLYVLQGRDENGKRTFRNSSETIRLGETEEKLFRDEKNEAVYGYIVKNEMTTEEVINTLALKTEEDNELGFGYGFLDSYDGYHSK